MSVTSPAESGSGWYAAYEGSSPSDQSSPWIEHEGRCRLRCPALQHHHFQRTLDHCFCLCLFRNTPHLDVSCLLRAAGERQCQALLDDHVLHFQSGNASPRTTALTPLRDVLLWSSSSAPEPRATLSDTSYSGQVAVQLVNLLMATAPTIAERTSRTAGDAERRVAAATPAAVSTAGAVAVCTCFCSFDVAGAGFQRCAHTGFLLALVRVLPDADRRSAAGRATRAVAQAPSRRSSPEDHGHWADKSSTVRSAMRSPGKSPSLLALGMPTQLLWKEELRDEQRVHGVRCPRCPTRLRHGAQKKPRQL